MAKYRFIGVTEYAECHLISDELENLKDMIGCEVEESDEVAEIDGGKMFVMPYGEDVHIVFLILEEIK